METNVDKYIQKFATVIGASQDGRSHYYQFGNKVVRVSDHIGRNSDGSIHIIVKPNGYILHYPSTGGVAICNYRQVQELIRTISILPDISAAVPPQYIATANGNEDNVMGIPVDCFTDGQLMGIKKMVNKVKHTMNG